MERVLQSFISSVKNVWPHLETEHRFLTKIQTAHHYQDMIANGVRVDDKFVQFINQITKCAKVTDEVHCILLVTARSGKSRSSISCTEMVAINDSCGRNLLSLDCTLEAGAFCLTARIATETVNGILCDKPPHSTALRAPGSNMLSVYRTSDSSLVNRVGTTVKKVISNLGKITVFDAPRLAVEYMSGEALVRNFMDSEQGRALMRSHPAPVIRNTVTIRAATASDLLSSSDGTNDTDDRLSGRMKSTPKRQRDADIPGKVYERVSADDISDYGKKEDESVAKRQKTAESDA